MYYFVGYLYVSCSGSITSVGEERAYLSVFVYLELYSFCSERFPLPLGAWDGLRYFIVALSKPSIYFLVVNSIKEIMKCGWLTCYEHWKQG